MTPRENFQRMMAHDQPAWLPLDVPVTPPVRDRIERETGAATAGEAFDLDFQSVGYDVPDRGEAWREAFARLGAEVPPDAEIESVGVTHTVPSADSVGEAYHFRRMLHPLAPVESVEQLEGLPWPDLSESRVYAGLPAEVEAIHRAGRVVVGSCECTVFEHAWYVRGMDNLFLDLHEVNGIGEWLLDWYTQRSVHVVQAYARAGVDVIGLGDDVGTQRGMMMAADFWRTHLKPRLKRVIDAIRDVQRAPIHIRYHSDGNIIEILDDLVELGVDILNPVQPECMDPKQVIPAYQDRLAFWGMVGTQTTMPFGSPDDVRRVVRDCADLASGGAALVVAPTHVLEPDVPWENICTLVAETKGVRWPQGQDEKGETV